MQNNQLFEARYQKKQYDTQVAKTYTYFRLFVSERQGSSDRFQLAEWQLFGTALAGNCITTDGGILSAQHIEGIEKLIDKDDTSIYQVNSSDLWLEYKAESTYIPSFYSITTADAFRIAILKHGYCMLSKDGEAWVEIDQRNDQQFPYRESTYTYSLTTLPSASGIWIYIILNYILQIIMVQRILVWPNGR